MLGRILKGPKLILEACERRWPQRKMLARRAGLRSTQREFKGWHSGATVKGGGLRRARRGEQASFESFEQTSRDRLELLGIGNDGAGLWKLLQRGHKELNPLVAVISSVRIDSAQECGMIGPRSRWQVASAEEQLGKLHRAQLKGRLQLRGRRRVAPCVGRVHHCRHFPVRVVALRALAAAGSLWPNS